MDLPPKLEQAIAFFEQKPPPTLPPPDVPLDKLMRAAVQEIEFLQVYRTDVMAQVRGVTAINASLEAEIERLRVAVRQLGEMGDTCTYDTLGEICSTCRCERRASEQKVPT